MNITNYIKRGYLATKDKLIDIKFFFKPSNTDNKIKHAFHELEYCNDRTKLVDNPAAYQGTCQKAYSQVRDLLLEQIKSASPNEHTYLFESLKQMLPQNYNQGNFKIIKGLYKAYIACKPESGTSNEECNTNLNEAVIEIISGSLHNHNEHNNWYPD